jgi:AraC-like DNA-binding protein
MAEALTPTQSEHRGPGEHLSDLSLRVLTCRRVKLSGWGGADLTAPYWRVYCNDRPGATIVTGGHRVPLTPGRLWIIPPETPYQASTDRPVYHFYLHFTIAPSHHPAAGRIYSMPLTDLVRSIMDAILDAEGAGPRDAIRSAILAEAVATTALTVVPAEHFRLPPSDARIRDVLKHMRRDPAKPFSNDELARQVSMNTNAFVRLFRTEIGLPPQEQRMRLRIERACMLLHTTDQTIEAIAERLGFCDRYHFSRAFKSRRGMGPATFRRLNPSTRDARP